MKDFKCKVTEHGLHMTGIAAKLVDGKMTIKQFDPVIYPRMLWIAVNPAQEILQNMFGLHNLDVAPDLDSFGNADEAITFPVYRKMDKRLGIVVCVSSTPSNKAISHESNHVADYFNDELDLRLGSTYQTGEAKAYLVGWAAECIEKAIKSQ